MCDGVFDDEEDGNGDGEGKGSAAFEPVRNILSLLILVHDKGFSRPSIDHACAENAENGSMGEVYGEAVATNPHEKLVREEGLERWREPDSCDHQVPADCGPAFGVVGGARWEDIVADVGKLLRPCGPVAAFSRIAGHVETENQADGLHNTSSLSPSSDKIPEAGLRTDITQEYTVQELDLKGF